MKSSTLKLLKEFSAGGGEIFGKNLPEFVDGKRAEVILSLVSEFDKVKNRLKFRSTAKSLIHTERLTDEISFSSSTRAKNP